MRFILFVGLITNAFANCPMGSSQVTWSDGNGNSIAGCRGTLKSVISSGVASECGNGELSIWLEGATAATGVFDLMMSTQNANGLNFDAPIVATSVSASIGSFTELAPNPIVGRLNIKDGEVISSHFASNLVFEGDTHFINPLYISRNNPKSDSRSIMANGYIQSNTAFYQASDRRIKKDIRPLKDDESLNIVRGLDAKMYHYVDTKKRGELGSIGFIAQEVKEILPQATSQVRQAIPNIMKHVTVKWRQSTDSSWTMTLDESLEPGTYRFIMGDNKDMELNSSDGRMFTLGQKYSSVFLYGRVVDDFLIIDKPKIFAVAYSALQQIDKHQQVLKSKVSTLEAIVHDLSTRLQKLESK